MYAQWVVAVAALHAVPFEPPGSRVTIGAATTKQNSACSLTGQITLARRNPAVMLARLSIDGVA